MDLKLVILFSGVLGLVGAAFMARYAYVLGLVDIPNSRSSHTLPTPRGGGVGILLAFMAVSVLVAFPVTLWGPASFLALVSFFDDKLDLSPRSRLVFQFSAALVVAAGHFLSPGLASSDMYLLLLAVPTLATFIVGTANFYNFMDGINGIAGITGAVAFGLVSAFAGSSGREDMSVVAACIAAACIGFLPMNMPRARVFMGDVGSIFLGFIFAVMVVTVAESLADFIVIVSFLFTFYADGLTTLYFRWRQGEKLSQAHRRHLYQLLCNRLGWQHWQVAVLYGAVQIVVSATLLLMQSQGSIVVFAVFVGFSLLFFIATSRIRKIAE